MPTVTESPAKNGQIREAEWIQVRKVMNRIRHASALCWAGAVSLLRPELACWQAYPRPAAAASPDQLTWGVHVSLAPTWFEPAEASGIITPFMVLYALHDAMVKPMPGNAMAPSLAAVGDRFAGRPHATTS